MLSDSEKTELSTIKSGSSDVSTIRDSESSQLGYLSSQLLSRQLSQHSSVASKPASVASKPAKERPPSLERPASPTKRPISPALAQRAALFGGVTRSQSEPSLPLQETNPESSRTNRGSQLNNGRPSSPASIKSSSTQSMTASQSEPIGLDLRTKELPPLREWVRTTALDRTAGRFLDPDTPPSPRPLSFTSHRSQASNSSTVFTIGEDVIKHSGHLHYGVLSSDGKADWRACRAVLISDALLVSYANPIRGQPEVEKRIQLKGCVRSESVRQSYFDAKQGLQKQVFELVWSDNSKEVFACERAVERATWVAAIL
jgi:hypothetical protein